MRVLLLCLLALAVPGCGGDEEELDHGKSTTPTHSGPAETELPD